MVKVITLDNRPAAEPVDYRPELESGNVLFVPRIPFAFPDESKDFLRNLNFDGGALHKNVAYRPLSDRVTGIDADASQRERLRDVLRNYSRNVVQFATALLPQYAATWKLDYTSFRPLEEMGRDLPLLKRNDLIHTDAFPSRPTNGNLILRVFTNIHPSKTRNWITTDPFRIIAERYASAAGLEKIAAGSTSAGARFLNRSARFFRSFGLPLVSRSPYDRFMLRFHDYLKRNEEFQKNCPKYSFDFPPDSLWLTFTDVLPHSVHSGQHALEQTFIVARTAMANPEKAPVSILERICGKPLLPREERERAA